MNRGQRNNLLALATMVELNKRVLNRMVGEELSTKVDGESVSENAEILITSKLRERLVLKAG